MIEYLDGLLTTLQNISAFSRTNSNLTRCPNIHEFYLKAQVLPLNRKQCLIGEHWSPVILFF